MDTRTGRLIELEQLRKLAEPELQHYIEVKRDLSKKELCEMQIRLYAPCGCGSGKKFKFCCYQKTK